MTGGAKRASRFRMRGRVPACPTDSWLAEAGSRGDPWGMTASTTVRRASVSPGRRSLAQWARLVDECLRHLDDPVRLRQSPLAKLAGVGARARCQHPLNPHGEVLALQELLCQAVDVSLPALPPRKREFLDRYARGESIASIARAMGMSRPHLSRAYRPIVSLTVAIALRAMIEQNPTKESTATVGSRVNQRRSNALGRDCDTARLAQLRSQP